MTQPSPTTDDPFAAIEAWRRPLFGRLPADPAGSKATRRRVSRALTDLFEATVVRLVPGLILEIGAHEATFSTEIGQALPSARVVAFEANPDVHDRHRARIEAAGVDYVRVCVADTSGPRRFMVPLEGDRRRLRMGSMLSHTPSSGFVEWEVEGVTLDGFLGGDARRSNAVWIDVEGAAGAVIDGGPLTLSNCAALLVELETQPRWQGQRLEADIVGQLAGHGLVPVASDIQAPWQFNMMFLRRDGLDAGVAADCAAYRTAAEALVDAGA